MNAEKFHSRMIFLHKEKKYLSIHKMSAARGHTFSLSFLTKRIFHQTRKLDKKSITVYTKKPKLGKKLSF